MKREIISQIMHTATQTSWLQGFWKFRVWFYKTLKALFKGINWEGVVQEIKLGGVSFFNFLNIQYIHVSKKSLNWGLITLQTTPPPPSLPPTVVDWLGRLCNTFMPCARGYSHYKWQYVDGLNITIHPWNQTARISPLRHRIRVRSMNAVAN